MDTGVVAFAPPGRVAPHSAPGMPPQRPLAMPEQSLRRLPDPAVRAPGPGPRRYGWRRLVVFAPALLLAASGAYEMAAVLAPNGFSVAEWAILILFTINFAWIALTLANALAGFIVGLGRTPRVGDPSKPIAGKTAIVLPTYNEEPDRIFAAIEAMARGLAELGESPAFDWFILSDSTDPRTLLLEELGLAEIRRKLAGRAAVYYRRRPRNIHKKAGNVADFCRRWGGAYDYMLVLDADSLLEPATIVALAQHLEADPAAGLIQTVPRLINGRSLLARLQQFAGAVYGPVLARGLAWWSGNEGNYWGHNAIVRIKAFAGAAGLPTLTGRPPFGGAILSHDFVEAALLRRAGWSVKILPDLGGSYEEGPPALLDLVARDRRWCQGNLQHVRILPAAGLHWASRFHMVTGIISYLAAPLWVMLVLAGIVFALQAEFTRPVYFSEPHQLFPDWPRIDSERAFRLFAATTAVLFAPKVLGLVAALLRRRPQPGGRKPSRLGLVAGTAAETVVMTLLAPLMIVAQTGLVLSILARRDAGWTKQRREGGATPPAELFRRHRWHMLMGFGFAVAALFGSDRLLLWLAPALAGLILAMPLSAASGSERLGRFFRRLGLLTTPEEVSPPAAATAARGLRPHYAALFAAAPGLAAVASDEGLRLTHYSLLDTQPPRARGEVDPFAAIAAAKIEDAASIQEALLWMGEEEKAAVIASPALMDRLARIPERNRVPDTGRERATQDAAIA